MTIIFPLPGNEAMGRRLAQLLDAGIGALETRRFPDGETYVRLIDDVTDQDIALLCTLAEPDDQILRLLFAADTARDLGARSLTLIAPYLAYMRQDRRFRRGEAITSRSFARLLSGSFDRLITVSPHLHRYASLSEIYQLDAVALDAAAPIAAWITAQVEAPLLIGPDRESEQWVASVAQLVGAPYAVATKLRHGDRSVAVQMPPLQGHRGRQPVLVDDVISSGATLRSAATALRAAGFRKPICVAVHGLQSERDATRLRDEVDRLVTTDSIPNDFEAIGLAPLLASAWAVPAMPARPERYHAECRR